MRRLSDAVVSHLQNAADRPDMEATRYDLGDRIGSGGMGSVYVATDRVLRRQVAIKVLRDPGGSPELGARLLREAEIIARLEHPGIVPVHDAGTLSDGRVYYVMKLVRGDRLDSYAAGRSTTEMLRIFQRICETVAFAHDRWVIHRDLKPQNVMVGPFGEVLVLDWGVAKVLRGSGVESSSMGVSALESGAVEATLGGTVLGTPGYMAPEQAQGEVDRVDARTDVYALGSVLAFLLTGKLPSVMDENSQRHPAPLFAISRKARSADPEARYQTAMQLGDDVARYLDGLAVQAYPENLFERTRRLTVKYQTPILLVLAYLLMRAMLLIWA
jgi:eukaryotic-like serine/threonine-protein kinase